MMLIDLHAHVIPDELAPAGPPERPGPYTEHDPGNEAVRLLLNGKGMRFSAERAFFEAEARLEAMDRNGVDVEAVSPMPPLLDSSLPTGEGRDLCRRVNEFVVAICSQSPTRMIGMGIVPLQDIDLAASELAELKTAGLKAVEVTSNVNGISIGDDHFLPFFEEAERLDMPVLVHATGPTFMDRMPRSAGPSLAVMAEQAVGAASVVMGSLPQRCPDLRLCFTHGGGGLAFMLSRAHYFWGHAWDEGAPEGHVEGISPSEIARRYFYDAHPIDRRAFQLLIDVLGDTQLVVGTDFPAMPREMPCAKTLYSMDLEKDALERITWSNAFRFLGIEPPQR